MPAQKTAPSPALSARGRGMPASPIRKLAPSAERALARGMRIFKLNIGQPDVATAAPFIAAYRGFEPDVIGYAPSDGFKSYREAIVRYYGSFDVEIGTDDLVVTTGGSEALMMAFAACCDPGDDVLLFEPCYPNYIGFATWLGVKTSFVTTTREQGYHLPDRATIEARIGPRTRAMVVCNPGNPTGTVHTRDEIEMLADIARSRGIFLISDEVYRELVFGDAEAVPVLSLPGMDQHAIQVDSTSKRYSACGARIGWVTTRNADLRAAMLKMGQARLSAPTVGQLGGEAAIGLPDDYRRSVVAEYKGRRDVLVKRLEAMPGVELAAPDGAFYIMVELPVDDTNEFCAWLLEEHDHGGDTVMLAPGEGFYGTPGLGTNEARIAYVLDSEDLDHAMDVLESGLAHYPGRKETS